MLDPGQLAEGAADADPLARAAHTEAELLPQSTCNGGELCAPCYDPTTGAATGSCSINGDSPQEPPKLFTKCCGDLGSCVPISAVPAAQQSLLSADTCTGQDELCAPTALVDPSYVPPTCNSIGGLEGRCLPSCLPDIAAQADRLPQDSCAAGHLCAPCYDPITGASTGACTLNGDSPGGPAQIRFEAWMIAAAGLALFGRKRMRRERQER